VWSKAGRFVEGLHAVGGVIPVEKISIIYVLNFMLCIPVIIECYHVFVVYMNYCLFYLNLYGNNNSVLCVLNLLKCMLYICMCVCVNVAVV
jgi:hypothetical protein